MRSKIEVKDFKEAVYSKYVYNCKKCNGRSFDCGCRAKSDYMINCFEACIPRDFWFIKKIEHNLTTFNNTIEPYLKNINKAIRKGYGLLLTGDNGSGKTYFLSYILTKIIKLGLTTYFTTMQDLDYNIKRGFNDKTYADRLQEMLTSDFVAIDELGKEKAKNSNSLYMDAQIERIVKRRIDDCKPMLFASNLSLGNINKQYGDALESMLGGKFLTIQMEPGDFRKKVHKRMLKEMGY